VTAGPGPNPGDELTESQRQFSQVAEAYRRSPSHADPVSLARFLGLAELRPNHRVLDLATGTGNVALAAAAHVAEVVGLDITPRMLEQAKQQAAQREIRNVTFIVGDAERLPFAASTFDRVLVRSAPHHFQQLIPALGEAYRVLRPGGVFAVSDCSPPPVVRDWLEVVEVGRDVLEPGVEQLAQALERRLGALRGGDLLGAFEQRVEELVADRHEQVVAACDVVVEGARGEARLLEQRGDRGRVVAALGEDVRGGVGDLAPAAVVAGAKGWAGRCSWHFRA